MSILLVANIAAMLIAFLAMKEFLNAILCWLGGMFDKCVTFEVCWYTSCTQFLHCYLLVDGIVLKFAVNHLAKR